MNLATILSMVFWMACAFSLPAMARGRQPRLQSAPDQSSPPPAGTTGSSAQPAQNPPASASSSPQNSSAKAPATNSKPRKRKHQKTTETSNCATTATSQPAPDSSASANAAGAKSPASTNCPPAKTVVKNGGTSEPAIQLTGTQDAAQAQQGSTTDQLLGSTDDNLKKIAGRQLTSSQQEMVSQIRQYMEQSKEAVTAGDTERGRMLAQKARLLSDELVKP